jgi:hypothetical protein
MADCAGRDAWDASRGAHKVRAQWLMVHFVAGVIVIG